MKVATIVGSALVVVGVVFAAFGLFVDHFYWAPRAWNSGAVDNGPVYVDLKPGLPLGAVALVVGAILVAIDAWPRVRSHEVRDREGPPIEEPPMGGDRRAGGGQSSG
ncbi:MAG: hypothetical protein ACYDCK_02660 [Thermoplasmatota archaeon]